jgi:TolB-like protein/DNA-binding winged helix-turn-helix (wHTH) protein
VPGPVYQFGDFRLDPGRFELLRNGHLLRIERKPMELLILLASHKGQLVTRDEIAQRLWSSGVFVDTEHGINTAISKLRYLLRDDAEAPRFIQTVTGVGYRFIAPAAVQDGDDSEPSRTDTEAGLPEGPTTAAAEPALISPEKAGNRARWRWLAWAIPCVLLTAAAVGLAARFRMHQHRATEAGVHSLAVLPLDNLSGDPGQEYFADGMTDELTTMLAKDSTLRIPSRTSVMQYKGAHRPLPEIARALNVDGILEGSVSRNNDHVQLTLQLIRADTDSHLWAESYDRSFGDAPSLPDEAAAAIAKELHQAIPARPVSSYVNPEAHDAYLRGRYLWENFHYDEAGKNFLHAVAVQPDYAPGWAGVAEYYAGSSVDGYIDPRDGWPKAESAVVKSLQLDPSLAEGHSDLAAIFFFYHWDWEHARREIRRAYELDSHWADNYQLEAKLLAVLNEKTEAVAVQKKAMEFNPFVRPWGLVMTYDAIRDYDAALEEGKFRLKTYPQNPPLLEDISEAQRGKGMMRESTDFLARELAAEGDTQSAQAVKRAFLQGGYAAVVRWRLATLLERAKSHYVSPVDEAELYAELSDREKTLTLLEEGLAQRSSDLLFIQSDPAFNFVHEDPRYRSVIQRVGLPPQF